MNILNLLRREPVQIVGFFAAGLQLIVSLLAPLTIGQQGAINAAIVVVAGVVAAFAVSAEKAAPLIAGLIQALIALAASFGLLLAPQVQGALMTLVTAGIAFYIRTQVVANVPVTLIIASGNRHAA